MGAGEGWREHGCQENDTYNREITFDQISQVVLSVRSQHPTLKQDGILLTKNKHITATPSESYQRPVKSQCIMGHNIRKHVLTGEAVDARRDGAFVSQVARDATLVLGSGAADERGVKNEAVLGRVSSRLQRPGRTSQVTQHGNTTARN